MRSLFISGALLVAATSCKRDEVPIAHDRSLAAANTAAREARRGGEDLRPTRTETSFAAKRDQVVAQARTSLAAMDQKIAELESYAKSGKVRDPAKAEARLDVLRDARRVAAASLDDLAISSPDSWDTRRVAVEKTYADLDKAYKDARDPMTAEVSTEQTDRARETHDIALPR